ncbi:hypothetical protein CO174_03590 [Candidatus Uhrbacteria bacterium CG_4_9_14_3_um_filter_50_9]|uniref:Uncharacterized protein n=1 Tax=Candidatus Uhrbacteria bacterium CG_4_9_14_3_um_filter_50_9 TaxID=1975035 RepID=A0A2M7XBZ8_9BACT|nr:MAG: hypothetical protein CO174_03590 [Candidatus Uhrbacteria bacterium CG_4_9_14_3_um_filter_50_9]
MIYITRLIQLLIMLTPVIVFSWLLTQWLVPSGVFAVAYEMGDSSPFIDELKPSERVDDPTEVNGEGVQAIVADPAFFFLHPHREFERIDLEVWFQNEDLPLVEIGALTALEPETYTMRPLHNKTIDDSSWDRMDEDGYVLLQREPVYSSVAAFLADPPDRTEVATYRTDLETPYRMNGYTPSTYVQTIDVSLRGHHEAKTYIKNETLSFTFDYMDMNRDEGEDVVSVLVFNEAGQPVAEARASDDGNTTDDAVPSGLKRLELEVPGLPEGVYKLVLNAPRDIFFRKIYTTQQKLVFLNTVYLGDEVAYHEPAEGGRFWTNGEYLRFQTRHAEGIQTVTIGDDVLLIEEPYEWYAAVNTQGVVEVDVPLGDVEIFLGGKIAFNQSQYFNPDTATLSAYTPLEELGVNYVFAEYTSPRQEGDWLVGLVSFASQELFAEEDGTWKISFSTPFVEERNAHVLIHQLNTWFYREQSDWADVSQLFTGEEL